MNAVLNFLFYHKLDVLSHYLSRHAGQEPLQEGNSSLIRKSAKAACAVLKASAARKTKKEVENRWTFVYNREVKCVRKEGVPQIFR